MSARKPPSASGLSPRVVGATLLLGTMLLGGCASGLPSADEDGMQVVFALTNAGGGADLLRVWLVPSLGDAEFLGSVPAGKTERFRYGPVGPGEGQYQLVGRGTDGVQVVSSTFNLFGDAIVHWDSSTEVVNVERISDPEVP